MELKKAIERLSKEKDLLIDAIKCSLSYISEKNDWGGLVQAIDTVLAELKESKKEKWKPTYGDEYWFRDVSGRIGVSEYCAGDCKEWLFDNVPVFPTKEECEKYWHFMDTVKEKSYEFSKEEWENIDIKKYYITYRSIAKELGVNRVTYLRELGMVYFKTREDAQYIIDNFKEELLKYFL